MFDSQASLIICQHLRRECCEINASCQAKKTDVLFDLWQVAVVKDRDG